MGSMTFILFVISWCSTFFPVGVISNPHQQHTMYFGDVPLDGEIET